jgi:trans-aconitate methyltransferase
MAASLGEQYLKQYSFRQWSVAYERLPATASGVVLDLGCGVGHQTFDLGRQFRGCQITGIDSNQELIEIAERPLFATEAKSNVRFLKADLSEELPFESESVDGIWSSFVVAYFPELHPVLERWIKALKPGGWIALVEIDNLLGHTPLSANSTEILKDFLLSFSEDSS